FSSCGRAAQSYMQAFQRRRALMAEARAKHEVVERIGSSLIGARTLAFTETKAAAEKLAASVRRLGVEASPFHSEQHRQDRSALLAYFKTGRVKLLAAPKALDEGVDVPDCDLGLVLAAS